MTTPTICDYLGDQTKPLSEGIEPQWRFTENQEFGQLSTALPIRLAKLNNQSPEESAQPIIEKLTSLPEIASVSFSAPGFVNAILRPDYLTQQVINMLAGMDNYAKVNLNRFTPPAKIVVEYSSPNIAKPFTIGHLRSTIIGAAVANMFAFQNLEIIRDNHLGDWGTQFGKLLYAILNWMPLSEIEKSSDPLKSLVELYVRFHQEAKQDPSLDDKARDLQAQLESGTPELKEIWEKCVAISNDSFQKMYELLGIKFDTQQGESYYLDKVPTVLEIIQSKNLLKDSEGAKIIDLEDVGLTPAIITKTDGSTIYAVRDLATDYFRLNEYGQDVTIINEVGSDQSHYFEQLFAIEVKLGWFKKGQRTHLKHGMYRFQDGKISTREGNVIWLDEIINLAISKASEINPKSAPAVGIGAIKWNDLKNEAIKDVVIDIDRMVELKGNTGPYVQYSYARANRVCEKSNAVVPESIESFQYSPAETPLIITLMQFRDILKIATDNLAPHILCTHIYNLSRQFNNYYESNRIIGSDREPSLKALAQVCAEQLKTGLTLLGIETLDEM